MLRLLIVDNEDYVVDGLMEVFQQLPYLELEVIGAYSAKEALEWLQRTKIDIVISDIRMPGMDGMTLQREIIRYWPRCQVIFLSGYNEFNYAQRAIRNGAVDYVLKTDGDEVLIAAVEKAIANLRQEIELQQLVEKSKNQIQRASEALQMQLFIHVLTGDRIESRQLKKLFDEFGIRLNPHLPVWIVVGRVDEWGEQFGYYDRYLLQYCVQNIAGEYLNTTVEQTSFAFDRYTLVWLIQPKQISPNSLPQLREETFGMIGRFVQGMFERIQAVCLELLKLSISFSLADRAANWDTLSKCFAETKAKLSRGLGSGKGLFLVDRAADSENGEAAEEPLLFLGRLQEYLDNNMREPFLAALSEILKPNMGESRYFAVASLLISNMAQSRRITAAALSEQIDRLLNPGRLGSWEEAVRELYRCGEALFHDKDQDLLEQENELVAKVSKYVSDNLGKVLSLTLIADEMDHNSSYLSRLFKQKSGIGLAEFITNKRIEKAKELLEHSDLRIQEIAEQVGFSSVQYFYRVFKRMVNITPQEYRERYWTG